MSKPDWKTKPHERKRMTLQQENQALKARIDVLTYERDEYLKTAKHFREERDKLATNQDRYAVLRTKDVMILDGEPKYLKGEDLDKYCDEEHGKLWGVSLSGMSSFLRSINGGATATTATGNRLIINATQMAVAKKLLQEQQNGNDTGSESKEADQKDSGHYTDILRYAYWNRLRK